MGEVVMNSYSDQLYLVCKGLATVSTNQELSTFKYSRKVMYDYLWGTDRRLLECRGMVYNNITGELIQLPFKKSFNYLEDGNWKDVPLDTAVVMYKKYNGFMAACSLYKGDLLVSTTGSTDSSYAELAKEEIKKTQDGRVLYYDSTYLFEIVHESNPHIIDEPLGVYPLGSRNKLTGQYSPTGTPIKCSLGEAIEITNEDRGEGFMVYLDDGTYGTVCKMKTPYYIGKKKLMRMQPSKINMMYNPVQFRSVENALPEMWKDVVGEITDCFTAWEWKNKSSQQRRVFLEKLKG